MPEDWWSYVTRVGAGLSPKEIAGAAGIDPSQVSRWKNGPAPRAENAVRFARHLNADPLEALVATGLLTPVEAGANISVLSGIDEFSDDVLIKELAIRLRTRPHEGPEIPKRA